MTSTSASQTSRPARPHADLEVRLGLASTATPALLRLHGLVVGIDYDPRSGGIAPYTTGLADHVATAAADVTVLAGVPRHPDGQVPAPYRSGLRFADPGWCLPDGPQVIRLRPGFCGAGGPIRRALRDVGFFLNAVTTGRRIATDLVIGVTPSPAAAAAAAFLARRAGVPLITMVQGVTRGTGPAAGRRAGTGANRGWRRTGLVDRLTTWLAGSMERYALRRSAEIAVISQAYRPAVLAAGIEPERLHLLPNWIRGAPVTESRQSAREALGWPLDRFTVVYAAPIGPRQDLGTAIAAARLLLHRSEAISGREHHVIDHARFGQGLADWDRAVLAGAVDLVVVGDGSQRGALEQQAFGLGNVRFLDAMDADSHPLVLAAADVLLIVESGPADGHGAAGLLAGYLSAGRPVLAAVEDGGPTACELRRTGGAGLCVSPGDPSALAEAILSLQSAVQGRRAMGAAARLYARAELGRQVSLRRLDLIVEAALSAREAVAAPTGDPPLEGTDTNGRGDDIHSTSDCRHLKGRGTVDPRSRDNAGPTARKGR